LIASFRVETRGLWRSFGPRVALRDISLALSSGEILALFGPNGAGKTTLLRILATLLRPSRGQVLLAGQDPSSRKQRIAARHHIGFLAHQPMLYDRLTAFENLFFYARMYGIPSPRDRCRLLLSDIGLSGREEDVVSDYSRGMQQRLAIARALVHDPDLLLLDEPFSGLDPQAATFLVDLLRSLAARGKAVVFTSHDLGRGLALCHRAVILTRGALALDARGESFETHGFAAAYETAVSPPARRT